jgi:alcohol dehydrogenase (NADP+)
MKSRGLAVDSATSPLKTFEFERRELGSHDVALEVKYTGICHSDIHTARGEWGSVFYPLVPGHEIAGVVTAIGSSVNKFTIGDRIGVGVFVDSCRNCENCNQGLQQYCLEGMTGTYNSMERDGKNQTRGGYSNNFVINEDYAVHIPANLPLEGVAPLLCAGITLYSPIKHFNVGPKTKVAVMGLGGLGHMGVKFAVAMGADVTVMSHSPEKESDARKMGAHHFVSTKEPGALNKYRKTFDVILNTVSAELDINEYLQTLRLDGTLVVIGLPGKPYAVHAGVMLDGRRSLTGSMIGGVSELQEMLNFCGEKNIVSDVEVIKADYANTAYDRTVASDVKYRFVIDASTF